MLAQYVTQNAEPPALFDENPELLQLLAATTAWPELRKQIAGRQDSGASRPPVLPHSITQL